MRRRYWPAMLVAGAAIGASADAHAVSLNLKCTVDGAVGRLNYMLLQVDESGSWIQYAPSPMNGVLAFEPTVNSGRLLQTTDSRYFLEDSYDSNFALRTIRYLDRTAGTLNVDTISPATTNHLVARCDPTTEMIPPPKK